MPAAQIKLKFVAAKKGQIDGTLSTAELTKKSKEDFRCGKYQTIAIFLQPTLFYLAGPKIEFSYLKPFVKKSFLLVNAMKRV